MSQPHARGASNRARVLAAILALAAAGGWGMFAHSSHSAAEVEKHLHERIAALQGQLQADQARLLSEQKRADTSDAELAQLRARLSTAQSELNRLAESHAQVQAELAQAQDRLSTLQQIQQARSGEAPASLIYVKPRPAQQDVVAAQEALTELGYGSLEVDGVVGHATRQAVAEFQKANGLAVTGELYAETLQALLRAMERVEAQRQPDRTPIREALSGSGFPGP